MAGTATRPSSTPTASANLSYLTGFDPRFEEAILVVGATGAPAILVGNECWGTAGAAPLPMDRVLLQDLSLPSQPRDRSRPLAETLSDAGVGVGRRIGVVGWKTYARRGTRRSSSTSCGSGLARRRSRTRRACLNDAGDGLRVINEVEQLAFMEWAACQTSSGVLRLLRGLRLGLTEREAVALLGWNGWPLSCHMMLTAGDRATLGLLSPGDRPIERGDRFTTAFGIWGALNCRAGFVVEDATELPDGIPDYVEKLVGPYFAAIAEWYGAMRVGQTGGALQAIVDRHLGDPFFGIFLNPGHQIHLDEWVNSPISPGSTTELRSGMAFQVDVIPATGTPYFTTNIEDGISLADARSAMPSRRPAGGVGADRGAPPVRPGARHQAAGCPAVLEHPGHLPPFLLQPGRAMTLAGWVRGFPGRAPIRRRAGE
jgi:Xaa-Pro aminopeptidase